MFEMFQVQQVRGEYKPFAHRPASSGPLVDDWLHIYTLWDNVDSLVKAARERFPYTDKSYDDALHLARVTPDARGISLARVPYGDGGSMKIGDVLVGVVNLGYRAYEATLGIGGAVVREIRVEPGERQLILGNNCLPLEAVRCARVLSSHLILLAAFRTNMHRTPARSKSILHAIHAAEHSSTLLRSLLAGEASSQHVPGHTPRHIPGCSPKRIRANGFSCERAAPAGIQSWRSHHPHCV